MATIAHFTVTAANEAGVDLVLIQPSLLYYAKLVVVMLTSIFLSKISIRKGGVANGTSKNVRLGIFWQDLEISEAFLLSLEVLFCMVCFYFF